MSKPVVYLSGPLTTGDEDENVARALVYATRLLKEGFYPIIPHLNIYLERFWDKPGIFGLNYKYDDWMDYDYALLERCDALFRIPGKSGGADLEVAFCKGAGIPIFTDIDEMTQFFAALDNE